MDQSCADNFHAAFEEFKADGGKVDGVVEWVSDPDLAKQVGIYPIFLLVHSKFSVLYFITSHPFFNRLLSHCLVFSIAYLLLILR